MFNRKTKNRIQPLPSLEDGLYRYKTVNTNQNIDDLIKSADEEVEQVLQAAGVSPRPPPVLQTGEWPKQGDTYNKITQRPSLHNTKSEEEKTFNFEDTSDDSVEEVQFTHQLVESRVHFDVSNAVQTLKDQLKAFQRSYFELDDKKNELRVLQLKMLGFEEENADLQRFIDDTIGGPARVTGSNIRAMKGFPGKKKTLSDEKKMKEDLLRLANNDNDDDDVYDSEVLHAASRKKKGNLLERFFKLYEKWLPFQKDIRRIEAKFGGATASYFKFTRWLFLEHLFIVPMVCGFCGLHLHDMISLHGYSSNVFSGGYDSLPKFMSFSSYAPGEAVAYSACVVLGFGFLLLTSVIKLIADDRTRKIIYAEEGDKASSYAVDVLSVWDNSLNSMQEVEDYGGSLGQMYLQKLLDSSRQGIIRSMTTIDIFLLYCRRIIGFIAFIIVQSISFALIIYLTVYSQDVKNFLANFPVLSAASGIIISLALQVINGITPTCMQIITDFELWDPERALAVILLRVYLSNTLNIILIAISYLLLADPSFLFEYPIVSQTLVVPQSDNYKCRIDQVSAELFSLYVNDRVINAVTFLLSGLFEYFKAWLFKAPWVKKEADIQNSILSNINTSGLKFIMLVFTPLAIMFVPIIEAMTLKWERYLMTMLYQKPKRSWDPNKAVLTFTRFYVASLLLIGLPTAIIFLSSTTLPKDCAIQDDSINLCLGDITNRVCALNPASIYYDSKFTNSTEGAQTSLCLIPGNKSPAGNQYPECICAKSCGAFVLSFDAIRPLRQWVVSQNIIAKIWLCLFSRSYVAWVIVLILFTLVFFKRNTCDVLRSSNQFKITQLMATIDALENMNHRQELLIAQYKEVGKE